MPELQALSTPLIADKTLRRLLGFARPKHHTSASTQFDMGYERCKQDLLELVYHEIGLKPENAELHTAASKDKKPWWRM